MAELVLEGRTNLDIADELGLAPGTVRVYLSQIYERFRLRNRTHLAVWMFQQKLSAP